MNNIEQTRNAKEFVERWTGRGDEKQDAQSYWRDLLVNVLGVPSSSLANFISFERKVQGGYIDAFIEDTGVLIEQKSLGIDLNKAQKQSDGTELTPYGQAMRYGAKLPFSLRPRWIITSNFDTILVYDQENDPSGKEPHEIRLADLPNELYRLSFITDKANSRLERERELSVKAGEVVGKLYASLSSQYKNIENDPNEQRSLNILIVRLVFLLYAEDAGLLQHHGALYDYLKPIPVPQMRQAIIDLFRVLDTPDGTGGTENKRDPYLAPELLEFPYINGGLFSEENIIVPQFTDQIKLDLLVEASSKFDWSDVSPSIFGAVFESTLNPETRRAGGMHYTSIENIHKVIDPLFLDDLRHELESIEALKTDRDRKIKLKAFQRKLSTINILDPACGSGNFLTESYLSLRKLENRVIEGLMGEQMGIGFEGESNPIHVKLSQFYGIEINDFAVSVAKTALWIAESQMIEATQEIILQVLDFLPLKSNSNIVQGNALRMDWNDVLPAERCSFIIGNPPFISQGSTDKGQATGPGQNVVRSPEQNEDMKIVFDNAKGIGALDYVSAWYVKSADYMDDNRIIAAAFVSTNSIVQGQQVEPLWKPLIDRGIHIIFAHQSFVWENEASNGAVVYVVIIGFSYADMEEKRLYRYDSYKTPLAVTTVDMINAYLRASENVIVSKRSKPISGVPEMMFGNKPTDGGNLLLSPKERDALVKEEPGSERWIRQFLSADGLLNNKRKYCLWLVGIKDDDLDQLPLIKERVNRVRELRQKSTKAATKKKAETPWLFDENRMTESKNVLAIPCHSTGSRAYIPMLFSEDGAIPGNSCTMIPDASLYLFGILTSQFHNEWVRVVAGRFGPSLRYANTICYNTFVFPEPSEEQQKRIESLAAAVLDARANHPSMSLADLYAHDAMPQDLQEAHQALDRAVEEAYGVDFNGDEEKIVAHLFKLYAKATEGAKDGK